LKSKDINAFVKAFGSRYRIDFQVFQPLGGHDIDKHIFFDGFRSQVLFSFE
jgi:hypothetical protein